jgi:hypothetical protein
MCAKNNARPTLVSRAVQRLERMKNMSLTLAPYVDGLVK